MRGDSLGGRHGNAPWGEVRAQGCLGKEKVRMLPFTKGSWKETLERRLEGHGPWGLQERQSLCRPEGRQGDEPGLRITKGLHSLAREGVAKGGDSHVSLGIEAWSQERKGL